jgi:hypothetical protein
MRQFTASHHFVVRRIRETGAETGAMSVNVCRLLTAFTFQVQVVILFGMYLPVVKTAPYYEPEVSARIGPS